MSYELEKLVKQVERLPTLKPIATQIIKLCSDPQTPISRLSEIISTDQSIIAQILRIANSDYFNYPKEITSLEKAIVVLGFNLMRDIALSLSIYSLYQGFEDNSDFDSASLWEHAFLTGVVGKALAERYDPLQKDILYVGGLLHDIGKVVQVRLLQKDFILILSKSRREKTKLHVLERKILGFHHADVGGLLLQHWNLNEVLVNMVKYHHYPIEFDGIEAQSKMIRFGYLSNLLAHFVQNNLENIVDAYQFDPKFSHYFTFTPPEFSGLVRFTKEFVSSHKSLRQVLQ